ncbi:xylan 1,4-beta-xylosidase [Streptomyces sp. ET3-23]|uniref:xylan 1,4-beta-xylosidase n=1 Tax=Streptomyces sp. ET3-23 TaxID=2885643 RepID=UPI001D109753|nr:xylan 1,4-beta-xylosidase [Streptomyces sp. ET3-23]MCC2273988.1 xylan 1,4-beta-xylosidase [Streptomyces sp. ET3-23]
MRRHDGDRSGAERRAAALQPGWGFTHTRHSADHGTPDAVGRAGALLSAQPLPQNQHIMGWGAENPEPAPGHHDFQALDERVALMRATGAIPVLTLCGAPDWMKGGRKGHTDWSRLEAAPDPRHYADFARLAGAVARRYPDIRHFLVWNELKGFYDEHKRRWNHEGYTDLYNLVYEELKRQNPENLVGGPYVVADHEPPGDADGSPEVHGPWGGLDRRSVDVVHYWNAHKTGADFVVVDGASYTREGHRTIPDEFAATRKFADVTRWLRSVTGLPVWWAEWYVEPPAEGDGPGGRDGWSERHRTAVHATALMRLATSGAAAAFYWNPQQAGDDCPGCLWRSTRLHDGGHGLPMAQLLTRFAREFPPGSAFRPVVAGAAFGARIEVLADDAAVLVVNTERRPVAARVDGRVLALSPYEVRWLDGA